MNRKARNIFDSRMMRDVRESLRSQPGRVGLSFLSVMIGIVVLTVLLSILFGLQAESRKMTRNFGADIAALVPDQALVAERGYRGLSVLSGLLRDSLREEASATMVRLSDGMKEAGNAQVWAAEPGMASLRRWNLAEGRLIDTADETRSARVVMLTESTMRTSGIRLGTDCTIGDHAFRVVGILEDGAGTLARVGGGAPSSGEPLAVIPLSTAERLNMSMRADSAAVFIRAADGEPVAETVRRYDGIFRDPTLSGWDMTWVTSDKLIRGIRELQRLISLTAGSVAVLCLLLGGTTLMSLMLADVRQRIPEIGLRRSIGASRRDVALLFVTESCIITGAAALAGIVIAGVMLAALSGRIALPLSLRSFTFVIPVIVSIVLGYVFAFWPARVAAGLSPAQALRNA